MHAVVTKATIHDLGRGREFLNEKGIPALKQAPGFVAGNWVNLGDGTGRGMVIFESEEAARAAAEQTGRTRRLATRSPSTASRSARSSGTPDARNRVLERENAPKALPLDWRRARPLQAPLLVPPLMARQDQISISGSDPGLVMLREEFEREERRRERRLRRFRLL